MASVFEPTRVDSLVDDLASHFAAHGGEYQARLDQSIWEKVCDQLKKAFSPDPVPKNYQRSVLSEWTSPKKVKWYSADEASLNDCLRT